MRGWGERACTGPEKRRQNGEEGAGWGRKEWCYTIVMCWNEIDVINDRAIKYYREREYLLQL